MGRSQALRPLARPTFRRLAVTYAVNELGDWMGVIALSVLVFDRTGSVMATTALFVATGFAPAVLAPLFVARAEAVPPRLALPLIYCVEAAMFGALAVLAHHFSLAGVIVLAALDGALAITTRSLTRAIVVVLLEPHDELRAGNAILNVAFTGGAAVGPALAGLVVGGFGVQVALLLDAASFYLIGWILITAGPLPRGQFEPGRIRDRVRSGLGYVREHATLRRFLTAQAAAFVFFAAVIPVEIVFAKETLGASDYGYGLMLGSWGAGMVIGSFAFAGSSRASLSALISTSTLAIGLAYLGMGASPTLLAACVAAALGGAGNGVLWVSVISAVQELAAAEMQARMMSILESLSTAMPAVGFFLGGAIAALSTPRITFFVSGVGVLLILALIAPLLRSGLAKKPAIQASSALDAGNETVLELIAGGAPVNSNSGVAR